MRIQVRERYDYQPEHEKPLILQSEFPRRNRALPFLVLALVITTGSSPLAWSYSTGNYLWAAAVSRDGRYVIIGSDDMRVYFFDVWSTDGQPLWSYACSGYVRHVAISNNGSRAAAGDLDGNVFFFRPHQSGDPAWTFKVSGPVEALALSDDGEYLVAGDRRGVIYLFETDMEAPMIWRGAIPSAVMSLSFLESKALAVTAASGGVYYYGEVPSRPGYAWSFGDYESFPKVVITGDNGDVVAGASNGTLYLIDRAGNVVDRQYLGGAISALSMSTATHRVVAGSTNGNVCYFVIGGGFEKLATLQTKQPITSLVLSDDGQRISIANLDGTITTYEESLTHLVWTFHTGGIIHSLSMSGSGHITAAASDTGSLYLFNEEKLARTGYPIYGLAPFVLVLILLLAACIATRRRRSRRAG